MKMTWGEVLTGGLVKLGYTPNAAKNVSTAYLQYGEAFLAQSQITDCKKVAKNHKRKMKRKELATLPQEIEASI